MNVSQPNSSKLLKTNISSDRQPVSTQQPTTWLILAISVSLIAGVLFVYWQVKDHDFVNYDDGLFVYKNDHVRNGLSVENFKWAFQLAGPSQWHPLTWLSHQLDSQLFGMNPRGHHLMSVALHALSTVMLFMALLKMTGSVWPSAFVAGVFGVHPLNVESVAWIAERKNVLSGLLGILALWSYVVYAMRGGLLRYLLVVVLLGLGLMCKPMLVTLPMVLLLLDIWPLGRLPLINAQRNRSTRLRWWKGPRFSGRRLGMLVLEKLPLFSLGVVAGMMTIWGRPQQHGIKTLETVPLLDRLSHSVTAYSTYLWKLVWPTDLSIASSQIAIAAEKLWPLLVGVIVLAGITLAAFWVIHSRPYIAVGWFWYLGILFPVCGVLSVGTKPLADRYTYIPLVGVSIAVAWLVQSLVIGGQRRRVVVSVLACGLLVAFAVKARAQAAYWRNGVTLFEYTLRLAGDDRLIRNNLGVALHEAGRTEEAIPHFQAALRISPDDPAAHLNLATTLQKLGHVEQAIPHYAAVLRSNPRNAQAYVNLGCAYHDRGRLDDAGRLFAAAVRLDPSSAKAFANLGVTRFEQKRFDDAVRCFQEALSLNPRDATIQIKQGIALKALGRYDDAIACFRQAVELDPDRPGTHNSLAQVLERKGDLVSAVKEYKRELAIEPQANVYQNLGTALASRGKLQEAVHHYRSALELHPGNLNTSLNLACILATAEDASLRNATEAVRLAELANSQLNHRDIQALDVLAAAFAEAGRFDEALETAQTAYKLAQVEGRKQFADRIRKRVQLYQQRQPFRQAAAPKGFQ